MLSRTKTVFEQIRSIEAVCVAPAEVKDDYLKRLLQELPAAGVHVIWIDAQTSDAKLNQKLLLEKLALNQVDDSNTLLIAGSADTLALASGTRMATIGCGELLAGDADRLGDAGGAGWLGTAGDSDWPGKSGSACKSDRNAPDMLVENFEEVDIQFLDRIMKRAQGLPWTTVVTNRCVLREIAMSDMDALFELYAGEGITNYVEELYERPEEEAYTKKYIEYMYGFYGYGMWVVIERDTGKLMGRAGFSHQDIGSEIVLEMGYIVGVPWQRQGYATEICEKLIVYARNNLSDFETLNCFIDAPNAPSRRLVEKLGFENAGEMYVPGYRRQMLRYVLRLT